MLFVSCNVSLLACQSSTSAVLIAAQCCRGLSAANIWTEINSQKSSPWPVCKSYQLASPMDYFHICWGLVNCWGRATTIRGDAGNIPQILHVPSRLKSYTARAPKLICGNTCTHQMEETDIWQQILKIKLTIMRWLCYIYQFLTRLVILVYCLPLVTWPTLAC